MHPDEIAHYNQMKKQDERVDFFFEVFNIKEAIIKCMGMGLYFDVKSISILSNMKKDYFVDNSIFEKVLCDYKLSLVIRS